MDYRLSERRLSAYSSRSQSLLCELRVNFITFACLCQGFFSYILTQVATWPLIIKYRYDLPGSKK
jgi:hypothetical protein